jgi:hypothetical protein
LVAVQRRLSCAVALAGMIATPAFAADQLILPQAPPPLATKVAPFAATTRPAPEVQIEFAARFWYGNAKTGKSLYDQTNVLLSRLTYAGLRTYSAELYGRVTHWSGFFIKGYGGGGRVSGGHLQDEDFPPNQIPYSSTTSSENSGSLGYGSVDFGYDFVRASNFSVDAFVGYHFLDERVNAYGCTQTAGGPFCTPLTPVPTSLEVISQSNLWQSVRLGLGGSVLLGNSFILSAEAAWLPYVTFRGADDHLLRENPMDPFAFNGPIREDGTGQGYQLEALLSYNFGRFASLGIGGRYWHMQADGHAHETFNDGATFSGPNNWKSDIYGVFVQAGWKFGVYPDLDLGPP